MLAGALASTRVRTPSQAVLAGALSHLIADAIPHSDYEIGDLGGLALAADLAGGAMLVGTLTADSPGLWAGAFGGILPDVLAVVESKLGINCLRRVHTLAHARTYPSLAVGVLSQMALAAALAYGLYHREERTRLRYQPHTL
jgi:hypothetical protein